MKRSKLLFGILIAIVATTLVVSGTLLSYFNTVETTLEVEQSVVLDGFDINTPIIETIEDAMAGCCYCSDHYVENRGCEGIWLDFEELGLPDLEGIDINYFLPDQGPCVISLPETSVIINAHHLGTDAYFDTTVVEIPPGYDVTEGTYNGWCVNEEAQMIQDQDIPATLWCSYDPSSPWQDDDWDLVNYIINHKHPDATKTDIQQAIWRFVNGGHDPDTAIGQAMVDDALANGEGFYPASGELIAVLVDCGERVQKTFIEVVFPECPDGDCGDCEGIPMRIPFYLEPGERIDFCICYKLDMLLAPGTYEISHKLVPYDMPR